jgi:hypothetical protein
MTRKLITFDEDKISKFIIFKVESMFETNTFKCVLK